MRAPESRSRAESARVGRLVCTLEHIMGCRIIALVGVTPDQDVFVTPQPGREKQIVEVLASMDWPLALRVAQEHFEGS